VQKHLTTVPDKGGHFGPYGGMFVPETLMEPLHELALANTKKRAGTNDFATSWPIICANIVGRPDARCTLPSA
jgi:tryptophan synthase beta chain